MFNRKNDLPINFTIYFFIVSLVLILSAQQSSARDIQFQWTQNSSNVDGYKIYYKTGNGGPPYDGTGILEGASPVDVGKTTTFTLRNLSDSATYYFVLTAYIGVDESDYSSELILPPLQTNNPPTAAGANISVTEDTTYSGQLNGNDADDDNLTYIIVSNGAKGAVSITNQATGAFNYQPQSNAVGSDSFTFKVSDGTDESQPATVNITINGVNDKPTATNGSVATYEDTPVSGNMQGDDVDGNDLTYILVSAGSKGNVQITDSANGSFTYTPNANVSGTDNFTFKVSDGSLYSNIATVNVSISAQSDAPVATNSSFSTNEDITYSGQLLGSDPDEDQLTYSIISTSSKGITTITNSSTGAFRYIPNPNISGTDSFTFKVNDGSTNSNTATVNITITPLNDPPVAVSGSLTVMRNTPRNSKLTASDVENDSLTYSIVSNGSKGMVRLNDPASGTFTYTPNQDADGSDSFTFLVSDGQSNSEVETISVEISSATIITEVLGDTPDSTQPDTLKDTFTTLSNTIHADNETITTYSWSEATPNTIANTVIIMSDLSNIPQNAMIVDAELHLCQTSFYGQESYDNTVHKIVGKSPVINEVTGYNASSTLPWTPVDTGTTQNNIPLGLANIEVGENTQTLNNQTGYKIWNITNMVQDWITTPSSNKGLLISGEVTSEETGRTFASVDNQNSSIRPKLIVKYTLRPPTPQITNIQKVN